MSCGQSASPKPLLNRIFQESIGNLFTSGDACWYNRLSDLDMADHGVLTRYLYESFVAPRFTRHRTALQGHTLEVEQFWAATKVWCAWFCDVVRVGVEAKQLAYDGAKRQWSNAEHLVDPGRSLTCALSDREWSARILVVGSAAAVLRRPVTGDWCVFESPFEPDRPYQAAALYHTMLANQGRQLESVTSIRCHPVLEETV
ncbi:MAG TPA: hypothetical protein VGL53_27470, partial [Bryobacteraceae bacterium]